MTIEKETNRRIPRFRTQEEEAEFWETHSPLDYPENWSEIKQARVERPLAHILGVRVDSQTFKRLSAIGAKRGIGPSTLARMWIVERLSAAEEQQPPRSTIRPAT